MPRRVGFPPAQAFLFVGSMESSLDSVYTGKNDEEEGKPE